MGVIHRAVIDVDEKGTKAAAASAVVMSRCLPPTKRFDSPFTWHIADQQKKVVLFSGRFEGSSKSAKGKNKSGKSAMTLGGDKEKDVKKHKKSATAVSAKSKAKNTSSKKSKRDTAKAKMKKEKEKEKA